ncbi:hypothetical protein ACHAWO_010591 [Cyclotella atomus]|uniref:IMS import disulfide relay-system CHCH-CHCH-like Cx9C domain-containing protein n=1 Tax=Cyclotella atomus TaxID=382360 RepID=A0ABD3P1V2_9STRA
MSAPDGSEIAFKGDVLDLDTKVMVTATDNRVLLDSMELNAASTPFNLCCAEAYAKFTDMKRLKVHPGKMTKERDAVESCSADVYKGIQSSCLTQFEAVKQCLSDNPKEWAACATLRRELDLCSVKSGLGEVKKAL